MATREVKEWVGSECVLATRHGKESAIARPMRAALALKVIVPENLDTDALGTFTGEVPRVGEPHEVARAKASLGIAASGIPRAIASEGSFGPHPTTPFLAASTELLLFLDQDRGIEVTEQLTTTETNFRHTVVRPGEPLEKFLRRARFPRHAIIVRPNAGDQNIGIAKGLQDIQQVAAAVARCAELSNDGAARIETDMRAHLNPTRMGVIRRVAFRLARRLATRCPACDLPGFGMSGTESGLPCENCGAPTDAVLHELWGCSTCAHREKRPRRDGRTSAYAGHCGFCNP